MKRFSGITTTRLARICGVSQGTVDRALHDRDGISPKTKERILAVAREYDYIPSPGGANGNGRSMLIGVVLFDLYNEFFSKLSMSLVEKAKERGYSVIFQFSNKDIKGERSAVDYFNYIGVDGIVLFSVGSDDVDYVEYLRSVNRPVVTIGNRVADLPYIGVDDCRAMRDITLQMRREVGDGRLCYFAPILERRLSSNNAQLLRLRGYEMAMEDRELSVITRESLIPRDASGVICSTDHYVLRALRTLGFSTDVRLAGFDNISLFKDINAKILTVAYSTDSIAVECMRFFLDRKYESLIPHSLVMSDE